MAPPTSREEKDPSSDKEPDNEKGPEKQEEEEEDRNKSSSEDEEKDVPAASSATTGTAVLARPGRHPPKPRDANPKKRARLITTGPSRGTTQSLEQLNEMAAALIKDEIAAEEKQRQMGVIYSRRKRVRQKIRIETLQGQKEELMHRNYALRFENEHLELLIRDCMGRVAASERRRAGFYPYGGAGGSTEEEGKSPPPPPPPGGVPGYLGGGSPSSTAGAAGYYAGMTSPLNRMQLPPLPLMMGGQPSGFYGSPMGYAMIPTSHRFVPYAAPPPLPQPHQRQGGGFYGWDHQGAGTQQQQQQQSSTSGSV